MKTCDVQRKGQPEQMTLYAVQTRYCPFHHHMLIAMRCVASNRPFLSTEDYFYKLELQHICPGESFSSFSILHHPLPRTVMGMNTDTFRRNWTPGLLLRSWHKAGLLPELSALTQCLKDSDAAERKRSRLCSDDRELEGESLSKKVKIV